MKILIEIPVKIDGPLTADERKQFQDYLQTATEGELKGFLEKKFGPGGAYVHHGLPIRLFRARGKG